MFCCKLSPISLFVASSLSFVPAAQALDDFELMPGESMAVSWNSTANGTIVNSDSWLSIDDGGTSNRTEILFGGVENVLSGGVSNEANISGTQNVQYGAVSNDAVINADGIQNIYSAGEATGTKVNTNGTQVIHAGGVAQGSLLNSQGNQQIGNDGVANKTIINGGYQNIMAGGTASDTHVLAGTQRILNGATAINTTLEGGSQIVYGTVTDTILNGGSSLLFSGARAEGYMEVNNDARVVIYRGAAAEDVTLNGGTLQVASISSSADGKEHAKVDTLTMNGGDVVFDNDYTSNGYAQLNIGELTGSGNFRFNTSLADKAGNFVTIGQGSGSFGVMVQDSGKEIADHTDLTVNLINDQGGDIDFSLQSTRGGNTRAVDGGAYMYVLKQETGKDGMDGNVWYLGAMTDENGGGDNNEGGSLVTTPSTDAVLSLANAGLNIMRGEMDGLRAARQSQGSSRKHGEGSVWGHYLGKKSAAETSNGAAYKLYQNGMEFGSDVVTDVGDSKLITGGFVSLTGNNVKHARGGTSSIDSYGLGAYATWYDNSGFYLDGTLKANRLESQMNARMTNGDMTGGKWHQYGLSAALETGYSFTPLDNLTVEPFARMTGTTINDAKVKLNNGMTAKTGKARSLTAEAGSRLATDFFLSNTTFRPYLSVSVEQELAHSNEAVINDVNRFKNHQNGTSGKYGAGITVTPAKDVTLYGELNYRKGSYVEEPVQGMAGIRISF